MSLFEKIKNVAARPNYKGTFYQMIFRFLAAPIVLFLANTPVTPNQVTLFSTFLYIIPALLFLQDSLWMNLLAVGFLYFINVLDKVDGELARLKKMTSKRGIFLDGILTNVCDIAIYVPLGLKEYLVNGNIYVLVAGFTCVIALLLQRFNYLNRTDLLGAAQNYEVNKLQVSSNWLKNLGKIIGLPNQHFPEILVVFILLGKIAPLLYFMSIYNSFLFLGYSIILSRFKEDSK